MSDMNESAPYVIKNALLEAGFSLSEIIDLAKNHRTLLKGLKNKYDDRKKPSRSGGAIETTGS